MTCVIETKKLTKRYGPAIALDKVDLHVQKGDIYGLIGDNGAGKSTLLKIIAGQSFSSEGELWILGKDSAAGLKAMRRRLGCMVEQPGFFPNMTVEQVLTYYCIQKGITDFKKTDIMLELTGITHKRRCQCRKLSLGQKQRLGLALAMLGEPQILILDEPINGLDPSGIVELRSLLQRLNEEKNITILISSHILQELQQIATRYGFLSKGRLIEEISAKKLWEKCQSFIEITVSDINRFAALFEKGFPGEDFLVLPNQRLRILHPKENAAVYSRLAAKSQVDILEMSTHLTSLEDYYINLKRGASND